MSESKWLMICKYFACSYSLFSSPCAFIFLLAACAAVDSPLEWRVLFLGMETVGNYGRVCIVEAILRDNIQSSVFSVNFLASSGISKAHSVFQNARAAVCLQRITLLILDVFPALFCVTGNRCWEQRVCKMCWCRLLEMAVCACQESMCSSSPAIPLTPSHLTLATKVNFNLMTLLSHSVSATVAANSVKYLS